MRHFLNIQKFFFALMLVLVFGTNQSACAFVVIQNDSLAQVHKSKLPSFIFTQEIDQRYFSFDSILSYRENAVYAAKNNDVIVASENADKFIKYSGETGFLDYGYFNNFSESKEFKILRDKYSLNINWLNFFYLFSAIIGFFISFILFSKRSQNRQSSILVSSFVLIHSLFIFHIFLHQTKLVYNAPHVLYMSAIFSYLYGPLIYFYFKKVTFDYKLTKKDALHLIPTILIISIMLPIFMLPAEEKHKIMLEVGLVDKEPYLWIVTSTKFLSLLIYGYLVLRGYFKTKNMVTLTEPAKIWIRNLVMLTSVYVLAYLIYAFTIIKQAPRFDFLLNIQILAMATMVLYIGYTSFLKPNLFTAEFVNKKKKYKKSGLTPSFSMELKQELLSMFEVEKIYRQNNISLAFVSEKLGTTRHNTSQVINEHFGLNFFELVNKFRIDEALEILKNDKNKTLNIIDVAYEVGFNNKVTFNKSFRKQLSVTPTQYLSSLKA